MLKDLRYLCLVVFATLLSGTASAQPSQVLLSYAALTQPLGTQCGNLSMEECTSTTSCTWGPTDAGNKACQERYTSYLQEPTGGSADRSAAVF